MEEDASTGLRHRQSGFRPWQGVCGSGTAWGLGSDGGEDAQACGLYTPFRSARDEGPNVAIDANCRIPGTRDFGRHQPPREGTNSAISQNWRSVGARGLGQQQACPLGPGILLVGGDCEKVGCGVSSSRRGATVDEEGEGTPTPAVAMPIHQMRHLPKVAMSQTVNLPPLDSA